ncbi:MAG: heme-binding protein [Chloroflexi bacterium]|nr:heme-binding protein [Chloroflexota bacterium]
MSSITIAQARAIVAGALGHGRGASMRPLVVLVLDPGGHPVAYEREDAAAPMRFKVADGKAHGALGLGIGSRALFERAQQQPFFVQAVNGAFGGRLVPVPGGVLVRDGEGGAVIGAVGVSGDTSDNDEAAAVAGIKAAGLVGDTG